MCQHIDIKELVRRYGGSASVALLDAQCETYSMNNVEGVIGYRTVRGCSVVFGDPVCKVSDWSILTEGFNEFCKKAGRSIVFVTASGKFWEWARDHRICQAMLELEEELVIDPQIDLTCATGSDAHQLRKKLNRAKEAQVVVHEYVGHDPQEEAGMNRLKEAWLRGRKGPQIYMANVHLFDDRRSKRWMLAKVGGEMVGLLLLHRLESYNGWLIHMIMADPKAPQGTNETLVIHTLNVLRKEGCRYGTFGATPREELGEITGLNPISSWVGRKGFYFVKKFFRLDGRREYWKKYKPKSERSFLLFSRPYVGLSEILGVLRAFNVSVL